MTPALDITPVKNIMGHKPAQTPSDKENGDTEPPMYYTSQHAPHDSGIERPTSELPKF